MKVLNAHVNKPLLSHKGSCSACTTLVHQSTCVWLVKLGCSQLCMP